MSIDKQGPNPLLGKYVGNTTSDGFLPPNDYVVYGQQQICIKLPIRHFVGEVNTPSKLPFTEGYLRQAFFSDDSAYAIPAVKHNLLSRYAILEIMAFDVDDEMTVFTDSVNPSVEQEFFTVLFNGHAVDSFRIDGIPLNPSNLLLLGGGGGKQGAPSSPTECCDQDGNDNSYSLTQFKIPMDKIRFPSRPGDEAVNDITISLGWRATSSAGLPQQESPYISTVDLVRGSFVRVDWAALRYEAQPPIALVHGINSQGDTWDVQSNFTGELTAMDFLHQYGMVHSKMAPSQFGYYASQGNPPPNRSIPSIDLRPQGARDTNGELLADQIKAFADSVGVEKVHIVAHSKGGLDSRSFLGGDVYNKSQINHSLPKVLSLSTISTPHSGSVIADVNYSYFLYRYQNRHVNDNPEDLESFWWYLDIFSNIISSQKTPGSPKTPGLRDLVTENAVAFNGRNHLPDGIKYNYIKADADTNDNGHIDSDEENDLNGIFIIALADAMYRTLAMVEWVHFTPSGLTVEFNWGRFRTINHLAVEVAPPSAFQQNDMLVTLKSAQFPPEVLPLGITALDLTSGGALDRNHFTEKDAPTLQLILDQYTIDFPIIDPEFAP